VNFNFMVMDLSGWTVEWLLTAAPGFWPGVVSAALLEEAQMVVAPARQGQGGQP
jgi:hypothetical protein